MAMRKMSFNRVSSDLTRNYFTVAQAKHFHVYILKCIYLALATNIRLGWKDPAGTNARKLRRKKFNGVGTESVVGEAVGAAL
jgi:hypothetical protein